MLTKQQVLLKTGLDINPIYTTEESDIARFMKRLYFFYSSLEFEKWLVSQDFFKALSKIYKSLLGNLNVIDKTKNKDKYRYLNTKKLQQTYS